MKNPNVNILGPTGLDRFLAVFLEDCHDLGAGQYLHPFFLEHAS